MPTIEEYAKQSHAERMERLTRTADELATIIAGRGDAVLSRRPDDRNWAAKEVVCHFRDTEAVFAARIEQVLAMDVDPKWGESDADRMAEEHQYLRNDVVEALAAFRRRRDETLAIFGKVSGAEWDKGGIHPARGRITIEQVLTIMAWHDDNHLDQIRRALEGRA